jgi:hypothetical protein
VTILFLWNSVFAIEDSNKTIKQLKDNIEVLKSKNVINFSVFEKFKQNNWELANYFSKNLLEKELFKIENIIVDYNAKKKDIKESISNNKNFELVELKKDLYSKFNLFIDKSKKTLYNEFVNKNILTIEKAEEIKKDIENKEKIIEKKVSNIKEKIEENHKKEKEKLELLLKEKIKKKIYSFKNNEKVQKLSKEKQKLLFKIVLERIQKIKKDSTKISEKQEIIISIIEVILITIIAE